jgi:hypothetical protein
MCTDEISAYFPLKPFVLSCSAGMYQFPYSQPSMVSYYVQQPPGGPVLMNPPPFPTYQYGLPPAPLCYPQQLPPPQQLQQQHAQPHRLHRSGSINAKIYSSDARYRGTEVLRHIGTSVHFRYRAPRYSFVTVDAGLGCIQTTLVKKKIKFSSYIRKSEWSSFKVIYEYD